MAIEEVTEPGCSDRDIKELDGEIIEKRSKGITKMDIKALRQADRVVFDINEIIAIKELENDPFDSERKYAVPVKYNVETYGKNIKIRKAFHWLAWAKGNAVWQTITKLLRAGDEITLNWCKGWGDNELLKDAGLTEDALYLHIRRKGQVKYSFLIGTQTGRKKDGGMIQ